MAASRFIVLTILIALLPALELPQAVLHHPVDRPADATIAGSWQRCGDGVDLIFALGEDLSHVLPGTYRRGGLQLHLRAGEDAGARARSLVGLPTLEEADQQRRTVLVASLAVTDHLALPIASWRLADGLDWPWVGYDSGFHGLPHYVRRRNPSRAGFVFAAGEGGWVDASGALLAIGGAGGLQPGDLLCAEPPNEGRENVWGLITILVADRGLPGRLDPADLVVCCQDPLGRLLPAAIELPLGDALGGPSALHCFARLPERVAAGAPVRTDQPPLAPDNPLWQLPAWRQMLALLGMGLVIAMLLRNLRRHRRARRES